MNRFLRVALLGLGLVVRVAHADLYLLVASPNVNGLGAPYPASLLHVGPQGDVAQIREIAPSTPGVFWVGVSYEERKALFVTDALPTPPSSSPRMIVVDFDKADIVKSCDLNSQSEFRLGFWLGVQPGMGLSLEWDFQPDYKEYVLGGMLADSSVPCEKSAWHPQPGDVRYIVAHGSAGAGGLVSHDAPSIVSVNAKAGDGAVDAWVGQLVPLGYNIPLNLRKGRDAYSPLMAANSEVFCLSLAGKMVYFRKKDETWHEWRISSVVAPGVRAFGKYLASTEVRQSGRSAGEKEWRTDDADRHGPPTTALSQGLSLPGRLLIYDTESENEYSILTNQGDSEVVLIQGGVVYYRSATRLYSAPLTKDGVGASRLIATSELIRDVHWAFLKP